MRYNGVDVLTVHPAISIAKEIPPGIAERELRTFAVRDGERLVGTNVQPDEYKAKINIAAKSRAEAWQVRSLLAAWATSAGDSVAQLIPTHWPQVAYDAICTKVEAPEFVFSHGVVEMTFALPCPYAYELTPTTASGTTSLQMVVGGSAPARPAITFTPTADITDFTLALDGAIFLAVKGSVTSGTAVELDTAAWSLLIGGSHAEDRIIYTESGKRPDFGPGAHTLTANRTGTIKARWHNRWR